jgi:hypothetical protein
VPFVPSKLKWVIAAVVVAVAVVAWVQLMGWPLGDSNSVYREGQEGFTATRVSPWNLGSSLPTDIESAPQQRPKIQPPKQPTPVDLGQAAQWKRHDPEAARDAGPSGHGAAREPASDHLNEIMEGREYQGRE